MPTPSVDITTLLHAHAAGDSQALADLLPRVYAELRRIARIRLRRAGVAATLSPTEVVHEAYIRMAPAEGVHFNDRIHFFALASRIMRNVLVDHAVRRNAAKRGGGRVAVTLDDAARSAERPLDELIELSRALERLEQTDERRARVVECRFFGGLSLDETAELLGTSAATVSRDWTFARAWLHRELATSSTSTSAD
jgi:RNA polymerase sigma factor (TIGR02999 family)